MRDTSCVVAPIRDHAFFEQPQFKGLFGNHFLQIACLTAQVFDLGRCRCARRVARQTFLASFEELLGPAVVEALCDALSPTQLGNAVFALQTVQHDPDLLFRRVLLAGRSADVFDDFLEMALTSSRFLSHLHSSVVTMC
jgi:hypothetical protein